MKRTRMFVKSSFSDRRFFGGGEAGTEARRPQPGYDRMTEPHHSPEPGTLPINRPDNQTLPIRSRQTPICGAGEIHGAFAGGGISIDSTVTSPVLDDI